MKPGFVNIPRGANVAAALGPQVVCQQRSKAGFPGADRRVGEGNAVRQDQRGQLTEAEIGAQPPPHDERDTSGRKRTLGRGRAGARMELALTYGTPKDAVATRGSLRQRARCRGGTRWATHPVLLGTRDAAATRIPATSGDNAAQTEFWRNRLSCNVVVI